MKYDFESIIDRQGWDAWAVEGCGQQVWGNEPHAPKEGFDFIPMWVADMNFGTAPAVTEAIAKRLHHPCFDYYMPRPEYAQSIIHWHKTHHQVTGMKPEDIGYENGVHGCVTSCVQVLSKPGEAVFLHKPFYLGFCADVEMLGRVPVHSELKKDENGVYRMDFEDMEAKIKASNCHLAIMCSPHNPAGRVWERWELEKAMEIFERNEVYVISDEIWADLTFEGHQHIPTQMVNEWAKQHTVGIYAPSKTFNLAGMVGSYHVIYNKYLRDRIGHYASSTHYNDQNVLSMHSVIGAYSDEGAEWTDELRQVLRTNCRMIANCLNSFEGVSSTDPEGTYMVFVDCSEYCKRTGTTLDELLKAGWDVGIGWQDGRRFGGECHIRMNVASPTSQIAKVCDRLRKYVFVK